MSSNNINANSRIQSGKQSSKSANMSIKVIDPYNEDKEPSIRDRPASNMNKNHKRKIQINIGDQDDIESGNSVSEHNDKKESPINKSVIDKDLNDSNTHLKGEKKEYDNNNLNEKSIEREVSALMKDSDKNNIESKKSSLRKTQSIKKSEDQAEEEIKFKNIENNENKNNKNVHFDESNRLNMLDDNANKGKLI